MQKTAGDFVKYLSFCQMKNFGSTGINTDSGRPKTRG